eukprot:g5792.t1
MGFCATRIVLASTGKRLQLVQAHVVHRHGDRSPGFNAFEPVVPEAAHEAAAWMRELVTQADVSALRRFPVNLDNSLVTPPRDEGLGVWAHLTQRGLRQMQALGKELNRCYIKTGFLSSCEHLSTTEQSCKVARSETWCTSSHYSRTQQSAQAVLSGLYPGIYSLHDTQGGKGPTVRVLSRENEYLNVFPHMPKLAELMQKSGSIYDNSMDEGERIASESLKKELMEGVPVFSFNLRPFSWMSLLDISECKASRVTRPIQKLMEREESRRFFEFIDADGDGTLTKEEIRAALPAWYSATPHDSDIEYFFKTLISGGGGDDIAAEKTVDLSSLRSLLLMDPPDLPIVKTKSSEIRAQVCKKFEHWYKDSEILSNIVGRFGSNIRDMLNDASKNVTNLRKRTPLLVLHSGHDVSVVPILRMLGVWNAADDWPGYGCALRLELLQATTDNVEEKPEFFVRLFYHNGFRDADVENPMYDYEPGFVPIRLGQGSLKGASKRSASCNRVSPKARETLVTFDEFKETVANAIG